MKRELIFYDYNGRVLGRTGEITAIYLKEYYNAVGTFEARFPASAGRVLLENDYVIAAGDGFKAIITSVTVDEGGVIAYGRTLNWILGRRLCAPFGSRKDENGETVTIPSEAALTAESAVLEAWEGCISVTLSGITGHEIELTKSDYTPCGDIVTDALKAAGLGHRVGFSPKHGWRFEVFEGKERRLILSRSLKNAESPVYTKDLLDYYSDGRIDGVLQHPERRSITDWDTAIDSAADLAKHKISKSITAGAVGLVCGRDYNIGDIVRVTEELCGMKFTSRLRVVGVEKWAEYNDTGERPILEETE